MWWWRKGDMPEKDEPHFNDPFDNLGFNGGISRIDIPDWQEECLHMFVKGFGSTYAHVE